MSYVFISYSSQSEDVVKALAQDIGALGHKVWFDEELVGGQVWWNEILTMIRECNVFAFLLTSEALESTPCQLEYKYADSLGKPILPILAVDDVSIDLLPSALSKLQYVDYRRQDKQAAFALVKAFSSLPPAQPLPDPLPQPPRLPVSYLGTLKEQVEATETLSFPEQTALLIRLKERLSEPKNADEVYRLLARLRKRDDLLAKVADEIDLALATMKESSSSSAPSLTQASTSERKVNVEAPLPTSKLGGQASGPNTTTGQAKEPITDSKGEPERNFVNKQADDFIRPYTDLFLPLISRTELKNSAANGNPLAKVILETDHPYNIAFEGDRLVVLCHENLNLLNLNGFFRYVNELKYVVKSTT